LNDLGRLKRFIEAAGLRLLDWERRLLTPWHRYPHRLCDTGGDGWWWSNHELSEPTKVLSDGCQRELELGALRAA
jgi:hypothetical protein